MKACHKCKHWTGDRETGYNGVCLQFSTPLSNYVTSFNDGKTCENFIDLKLVYAALIEPLIAGITIEKWEFSFPAPFFSNHVGSEIVNAVTRYQYDNKTTQQLALLYDCFNMLCKELGDWSVSFGMPEICATSVSASTNHVGHKIRLKTGLGEMYIFVEGYI